MNTTDTDIQRIAEEIAQTVYVSLVPITSQNAADKEQVRQYFETILAREFAEKNWNRQAMQEQANAWQAVWNKLSSLAEFGSVWLDRDTGCAHALRTIDAILARAERAEADAVTAHKIACQARLDAERAEAERDQLRAELTDERNGRAQDNLQYADTYAKLRAEVERLKEQLEHEHNFDAANDTFANDQPDWEKLPPMTPEEAFEKLCKQALEPSDAAIRLAKFIPLERQFASITNRQLWALHKWMTDLRAQLAAAQEVLEKARSVAYAAPELNMCNYHHEQVSELNVAMCEVFTLLDAARQGGAK